MKKIIIATLFAILTPLVAAPLYIFVDNLSTTYDTTIYVYQEIEGDLPETLSSASFDLDHSPGTSTEAQHSTYSPGVSLIGMFEGYENSNFDRKCLYIQLDRKVAPNHDAALSIFKTFRNEFGKGGKLSFLSTSFTGEPVIMDSDELPFDIYREPFFSMSSLILMIIFGAFYYSALTVYDKSKG